MRGFFGPARGSLQRVLLVESAERESGELLIDELAHRGGVGELDVLTCYDSQPVALQRFPHGRCLSVHAPEAVKNRTAYATQLARHPYDAVMVLCTGSGVLRNWKWLLVLKTRSRVVFADEYANFFFVTLRNPGPLLVLALRRLRIGTIPELLLSVARLLLTPFVVAFLVFYAMSVQLRRMLRHV